MHVLIVVGEYGILDLSLLDLEQVDVLEWVGHSIDFRHVICGTVFVVCHIEWAAYIFFKIASEFWSDIYAKVSDHEHSKV